MWTTLYALVDGTVEYRRSRGVKRKLRDVIPPSRTERHSLLEAPSAGYHR